MADLILSVTNNEHCQFFCLNFYCPTVTLPDCHTVTLFYCHTLLLSYCHIVTLSTVILSHRHTVVLSYCHMSYCQHHACTHIPILTYTRYCITITSFGQPSATTSCARIWQATHNKIMKSTSTYQVVILRLPSRDFIFTSSNVLYWCVKVM